MNHAQMLEALKDGWFLLGVEPAKARRLFTDHSESELTRIIGRSVVGRKFIVSSLFALGNLTLIVSMILAIFVWGWNAIWIIPLTFIIHFVSHGRASMGRPSLFLPLILLIIAGGVAWWGASLGNAFIAWILLTASLPLWSRLLYRSAASFVRSLALRSERAYEGLRESGVLLGDLG